MPPKKIGRPKRAPGAVVRIPLNLSTEEAEEFDRATAKAYPLATKSAVLRSLIEKFCREVNK